MDNLLKKASIIVTPTAYDDGSINAIKPEKSPFADLDFTRGSSATRVNSQGLIEDVQVIGDNLLEDLSVLGTPPSGFTIVNNTIVADGTGGTWATNVVDVLTIGKKYRYEMTSTNHVSGRAQYRDGTSNILFLDFDGTEIKDYIVADSTNLSIRLSPRPNGDPNFTLINLSVREVTDDTDIPRLNYTGSVGHWLLEPQSTNTTTYSNTFTGITNSIFSGGGDYSSQNTVLTSSQGTSPDGTNNAWKIQVDDPNSATFPHLRLTSAVVGSGNNNTLSVFAKKGVNIDWFAIFADGFGGVDHRAWFDLENGVKGTLTNGVSSAITDYGNGWYRCSLTFTATTSLTNNLRFVITDSDGASNYTMSANDHHLIYGCQGEVLNFPTSYIPTGGSTVTRVADSAINSGSSSLMGQTEGVLYVEIAKLSSLDTNSGSISINDGTFDNSVLIKILTSSVRSHIRASGIGEVIDRTENITDIGGFNKIAFYYKSGELKVFINGNQAGAISTHTFSFNNTLDRLNFDRGGIQPFNGKVKCVAVFKEALTDGELMCLTT